MYCTNQEVFDASVAGLAAQGFEQSRAFMEERGTFSCAYRGTENRRCAIGHLIPDEVYKPGMENLSMYAFIQSYPEEVELIFGDSVDGDFLNELQHAHDRGFTPVEMKSNLQGLASKFGLLLTKELI